MSVPCPCRLARQFAAPVNGIVLIGIDVGGQFTPAAHQVMKVGAEAIGRRCHVGQAVAAATDDDDHVVRWFDLLRWFGVERIGKDGDTAIRELLLDAIGYGVGEGHDAIGDQRDTARQRAGHIQGDAVVALREPHRVIGIDREGGGL